MTSVKLPFYARLALTLFALVLAFIILKEASGIFIPLTFALLVSILLYPFTKFLENKCHFGRVYSAITAVVLFVAALFSFIYFLSIQVFGFSKDIPLLKTRFQEMFSALQKWLSYKLHITTTQQTTYINRSVNSIIESMAHSISNLLTSMAGILLLFIFILIFTFFMLYHRRLLMKFVLHLFSPVHREKVNEVISETRSMINSYVVGLVIEMVVISIVNCSMLAIMGIQYAVLLGLMAAVLNIIPYLGIYTSIVICMLVTFANSNGNMALEAGIGMFVVHLLDSNILFPRIVGGRVKMNPFITIVAVIIGEFLWGVPGMFLFIPITGIIKLICERVEGLEAWSILIGVDDTNPRESKQKKQKKITP